MKVLFQYNNNPEREFKLRNVKLWRQRERSFSENCVVDKQQEQKHQKQNLFCELA